MAPRKKKQKYVPAKIALVEFPTEVVESYLRPSRWYVQSEPSCVNYLSIRKYRVTTELIDETIEVLRERLLTLWRTKSRNGHHYTMFETAARELGMDWDALFRSTEGADRRNTDDAY